MSRVAKSPVELPKGVEFKQDGNVVTLKGGNGELSIELNSEVEIKHEENALMLAPRSGSRSLLQSPARRAPLLPTWQRACPKALKRNWN